MSIATMAGVTQPHIVSVMLQDHAYDIAVAPGLLAQAGERIRQLSRSPKIAVVSDPVVATAHLPALRKSLEAAGFGVLTATIPSGEEHKTLSDLLPAFDTFLGARIDRTTPVIGFGGGIITDMAGFLAATMLRGVPLIQIPTTLLSMVDASVGGKTGVNHAMGKNLIGAFKQPDAVLIDPLVLQTLPSRELCGGLAECIKHEIIRDADGFAALEQNIGRALAMDVEYLAELIAHNVAIKARVVEADPFERGERAHLNYGHTFGHAIEHVSNYGYSHGESVALGMVAAARTAMELGMLDDASRRRIVALVAAAGLPTGGMPCDAEAVVQRMAFDKKVKGDTIRLVLPDRIGHVVIRDDVPVAAMKAAVERLR